MPLQKRNSMHLQGSWWWWWWLWLIWLAVSWWWLIWLALRWLWMICLAARWWWWIWLAVWQLRLTICNFQLDSLLTAMLWADWPRQYYIKCGQSLKILVSCLPFWTRHPIGQQWLRSLACSNNIIMIHNFNFQSVHIKILWLAVYNIWIKVLFKS